MSTKAYNCPSCGAGLEVKNRFSKVVICEYCGQSSNISPEGLDPTGQKTQLADFESILKVGASGKIQGQAFRVLGRLRYKYDEGFWDEWFLEFDNGKKIWLQEDEGEFTAFEKESLTSAIPPYDDISVGSMIPINDMSVFITEKSQAQIAGGVGELYFKITPGMSVKCVDGNASGKLVSIEVSPNEINLSIGDEISIDQIEIDKA